MLERFFSDPAAVRRHRNGLFGCHVDAFVASLSELGYARATVKLQLLFLGDLDKWLKRKRLTLVDLDDPVVTQFLKSRQRNGRLRRSDRQTARYLLEYLREKGAIQSPAPTIDESPLAMLRGQYENYLKKERGLSPKTITRYWVFLEQFLVERFGKGPICLPEVGCRRYF